MTQQNDTLRTIHSLRSTHGSFTVKEIDDADLRTILDTAVRAPNASARQSYSIVVVQDRARMKYHRGARAPRSLFC